MNKLALTKTMIEGVASPKELLELPAIQDNWIRTYESTSGKKDGALRFESEKILFLQTLSESYSLQNCDKFSIYGAWTELAVSGLTLRDGLCYIIPYGGKAGFQVGWKGRLEQITEMENITHARKPEVVYNTDDFDMELGEKPVITKHKRGEKTENSFITHVYMYIVMKHGVELYYMERDEVLSIRDRYSQSYKQYIEDCKTADKKVGETFKIPKTSKAGKPYQATIEPPMWITDEAQAFKKTLVKRVYNELPKLPKQKWLDERLKVLKPDDENRMDPDEIAKNNFDQYTLISDEEGEGHDVRDLNEDKISQAATAQNSQGSNTTGQATVITQPGQSEEKSENKNDQVQKAEVVSSEIKNLEELASNAGAGF